MEDAKIILESGNEVDVKGIFYIFNSRYYFMYTMGETLDSDYTQLYIVQVYKETQNTSNGPVDTGYLVGVEISNQDEWGQVQQSITKIVEDKKNGVSSADIQYLPINMLTKLKVNTHNKFKLMTQLLNDLFNLNIPSSNAQIEQNQIQEQEVNNVEATDSTVNIASSYIGDADNSQYQSEEDGVIKDNNDTNADVIIDYRAKFFEEQDKNKELKEQITQLEEKIKNIKTILE